MKEVKCAKCGKVEEVPDEQVPEGMPKTYEQAEPTLLRGESVRVWLCDECVKAIEAFRKTLGN